jgi:hypothetical protein
MGQPQIIGGLWVGHPATRRMGFVVSQVPKCEGPGAPSFVTHGDLRHPPPGHPTQGVRGLPGPQVRGTLGHPHLLLMGTCATRPFGVGNERGWSPTLR